MVYVYAIIEAPPAVLNDMTGIHDQPLRICAHDGVGIVFSDSAAGTLRPTPPNVWRHEQIAERLMKNHAVLPARFGTVLPDPEAVEDTLARHHEAFAEGLRRVRGCVELGVRVMWQSEPGVGANGSGPAAPPIDAPGASGRAYLAARLAEEQRRRATVRRAAVLSGELDDAFRSCAADGTFQVLPSPQFVMTGAYLVPRDRAAEFRRRVEDAGAAHPDLRLLCTGPWPPYHFVPAVAAPEVQRA
jgi:hypothetical protein